MEETFFTNMFSDKCEREVGAESFFINFEVHSVTMDEIKRVWKGMSKGEG